MFIEAVSGDIEYESRELGEKAAGSDGQRTYIILESGELCTQCLKNPAMRELGIEKITFKVYQLAEKKLFDMDFKVAVEGGRLIDLLFTNKIASEDSYLEFLLEVEKAASHAGAVRLAILANQIAVVAPRHQLPPDKSSDISDAWMVAMISNLNLSSCYAI